MVKKAGGKRASAAKKCSGKKPMVMAEAEAEDSNIIVAVDPKLLECSDCCSPLAPPIFECTKGHITCFKCCADHNHNCGLSALEPTHSHALERIVGGLIVPCSFREHGCIEMIPFTGKLAHEESTCLHINLSFMAKKASEKRASAAKKCSGNKAKVTVEAEASASNMIVAVDPRLLECSDCCSPLVPPIFECTKGHITCVKCCADHKHRCGLCALERTRSHALECIVGGLIVPCSFREHGCIEMISFTRKLAHEESTCLHTPCHCPIAGCGPYLGKSLFDHLNTEHPTIQCTNITAGNVWPLKMYNGEPARLVSLDTRAVFLLVADYWSMPSGCVLSMIQLVSNPAENGDFKYKIQVNSGRAGAGILSLSGETKIIRRLTRAYKPEASLFVSGDMWSPQDSPVYLELN